jgi:hypothetical protein
MKLPHTVLIRQKTDEIPYTYKSINRVIFTSISNHTTNRKRITLEEE